MKSAKFLILNFPR